MIQATPLKPKNTKIEQEIQEKYDIISSISSIISDSKQVLYDETKEHKAEMQSFIDRIKKAVENGSSGTTNKKDKRT